MVEVSGTLVLTVVDKPITDILLYDYILFDGRLRQVTAIVHHNTVMFDNTGAKYNWRFSFYEDKRRVSDTIYHWSALTHHAPCPTMKVIEAVLKT